jgi:hypothetical protein
VTEENQVIRPTGIRSALVMGTPTIAIRQQVTMQHLWTARHAARLCGEREAQVLGQNSVDTELRSQAMTSIFFATAFLEALVNDVVLDLVDPKGPTARTDGLPHSAIPAFHQLWKRERRLGILGKYQRALSAVGKPQYDAKRNPAKGVQLLVDLRNHFMHHQPEWQDVDAEHHFEHALKRAKVVENQQPIGAPWFANKALGAGLADWSCDIATRFANSWWTRIGLKGKFDAPFAGLPLP